MTIQNKTYEQAVAFVNQNTDTTPYSRHLLKFAYGNSENPENQTQPNETFLSTLTNLARISVKTDIYDTLSNSCSTRPDTAIKLLAHIFNESLKETRKQFEQTEKEIAVEEWAKILNIKK